MEGEEEKGPQEGLTADQKQQIQRNKERAQVLKEQRRRAKPYDRPGGPERAHSSSASSHAQSHDKDLQPAQFRNSHAGFMFDPEEDTSSHMHHYRQVEEEAPAPPDDLMVCEECIKPFAESYLHSKFQLDVCNSCREQNGKHSLITKTEAKQKFLLQDRDFEERGGPPLPFLLKKNPHSSRYGEMKLFLLCQVEARAHEVWGGEEGLEEAHRRKGEMQEKKREKKYASQIKALRKSVKTSLPTKSHVHTYPDGGETYDSDIDIWTKTCSECGFQVTFEKM